MTAAIQYGKSGAAFPVRRVFRFPTVFPAAMVYRPERINRIDTENLEKHPYAPPPVSLPPVSSLRISSFRGR
jgi:hypothetical protein